jgi:hypothetical protein
MFLERESRITCPWVLARKLETKMLLTKRLSKLNRARYVILSRYLIRPLNYGRNQRILMWMLCVELVQMKHREHCRIACSS